MNWMRSQLALLVGVAAFAFSLPAVSEPLRPRSRADASPLTGPAAEALEMRLAVLDSKETGPPRLRVEFTNAGDDDLTLHLGITLANGKTHFPLAIQLKHTDQDGKVQELSIPDPPIFGRMDYFLVPLPAGATYSLPLNLGEFKKTGKWTPVELAPGTHSLTAELKGPAEYSGPGSGADPEVRIHKPWTGRVQSNEVTLRR